MKSLQLLLCLIVAAAGARSHAGIKLPQNGPIVFLGDSITHAGSYITYLEAFLLTRYPEKNLEFLNLGLPSETVSGLSEPGHAGGSFPRPDLHERLERVLAQIRPKLVFACYGMNDGIYHPFSRARFEAYQRGIEKLVQQVTDSKSRIVLLTPPAFDPLPLKGRTLPAGRDEYRQPFEHYDEVLGQYSDWLLAQRKRGWTVIDIHGPMKLHLSKARLKDPNYILAGDGVHANPNGHFIFTRQLLLALDFPHSADSALLSYHRFQGVRGQVGVTQRTRNLVEFNWRIFRPVLPISDWKPFAMEIEDFPHQFNSLKLRVLNLPNQDWTLLENGKELGVFSAQAWREGVDCSTLPNLSLRQDNQRLLKLIHDRQRLLTDSWLNQIGHKRPGMPKGLPLDEARAKAAALNQEIKKLSAPVTLQLEIKK